MVHARIYHFDLTQNRTCLLLKGPLIEKVADNDKELDNVTFGEDSPLISDMEIGPDGNLYVVELNAGKIYKIVPYHFSQDLLDYLEDLSKNKLIAY